ncbi:MAG: GxxExxY protein [Candidatus Marinimicrobia bacterium]|nr:GxxExxY protein [Candidatus Neomarinimicrobiota bacterium]
MKINDITKMIVNAAYQVHRELGPGLLESVYEKCLIYELKEAGLNVATQVFIPIKYKNLRIDNALRIDILINNKIIIELKAVNELADIHTAQLLSYLKLTNNTLGLLINFNVPIIKKGIKRIINGNLDE